MSLVIYNTLTRKKRTLRNPGTGQGEDVLLRRHSVRLLPPGPRPLLHRVGYGAPLPDVAGV